MIIAFSATVIMFGGIIFLGMQFQKIDKVGLQCAKDPLGYAEKRFLDATGDTFYCECSTKSWAIDGVSNDNFLDRILAFNISNATQK